MEDLLPASLSYHFQKINEATGGTPTAAGAGIGLISVEMVRESLGNFREALARRSLDETWHLTESIDEILYPLEQIGMFLQAVRDGQAPGINERLAYICAFFAEKRVDALRDTAREIDAQYQRPAAEKC